MSKAEFDRLCQLSDDWSYRRPLEECSGIACRTRPPGGGLGGSSRPWQASASNLTLAVTDSEGKATMAEPLTLTPEQQQDARTAAASTWAGSSPVATSRRKSPRR